MLGVTGLAEASDHMVGVKVDAHSEEEYERSDNELRAVEPVCSIHSGRCLAASEKGYAPPSRSNRKVQSPRIWFEAHLVQAFGSGFTL